MLEDAHKEILSLIRSNEKVNFIAFDKNGKINVSTIESLNILTFATITEVCEYIEKL